MDKFIAIATVSVCSIVLFHGQAFVEGSDMVLPDDRITRNYFGWTVFEKQFSASAIMMTKTKRGHLFAVLTNGSLIAMRSNKDYIYNPARDIHVISASKDIDLFCLMHSNHSIYKCESRACTAIGSYIPSNPEEQVPKIVIQKAGGELCFIIANGTEHSFTWHTWQTSKQVFVQGDEISCSHVSKTNRNVVCYFIRGGKLFTTNITNNCEKTNDINIELANGVSPIAVSVYSKELWVIVDGGRWALRRLGTTDDRMEGASWMKFPLYLPSVGKSVVVGREDVYILMESGKIAKFQGFKRPEKATNHTFIDIETYDNRKVIALGAPNESVLQQNSGRGYVYELKNRLNSTWERANILSDVCSGDTFTGPVTIGVGGIMIVDKERGIICNASGGNTWGQIVSQPLDVAFYVKDGSVRKVILDRQSWNCTDPHVNKRSTVKGPSEGIRALTCKHDLCYFLDQTGYLYPLTFICRDDRDHEFLVGNRVGKGYLFSQIDISRSGLLVAIETSTNDVFVSDASYSMYDKEWINIPGIKLKSITVGDGIIYGIDEDGGMAFMERTNASWGSWSPWGNCSKPCNTGQQMRNRTCIMYQPSATLGGSNCTGNSTQLRNCNIHFCEDNCIRAKNSFNKTICCYLPNTVYGMNAVSFYNSCMPMSNCSFSCPLDKNATVFGKCIPMTQYSPWTGWSNCSHSCFTGKKYRNRTVTKTSYTRRIVTNSSIEINTAYCKRKPCDVANETWAFRQNGSLTLCYFNETDQLCAHNATDNKYYCYLDRYGLNRGICREKNGSFSEWSDWSRCDADCFTGIHNRTRTCSNPAPLYGGKCNGIDFQEKYCNNHSCVAESKCINATVDNGPLECCVLNHSLADGTIWDRCRDVGQKRYVCPLDRYKMRMGTCAPINGGVSAWSDWTQCNETCFTGFKTRSRTCTNPPPQYNGICTEHLYETDICNQKPCYDKSNCTNATVGGETVCCALGIDLRTRGGPLHECENVGGSFICPLDRYENNTGICDPIPGYFTPWSNWTECDCKTKVEMRTREYIEPKYGAPDLVGNKTDTMGCDTSHCPPEVFWTNWTIASPCPVTCGIGLQTWSRSCKKLTGETAPESECIGDATEKRNCSQGVCPGFKLGRAGQNCTQICDDLTLTCSWSSNIKVDYRTVMNGFLQEPCTQPSAGKRQWGDDWQPAYLVDTRECVGYENVKGSRCTTIKPVNSTVRRLCRCIYKDDLVYSEWSEWSTWSRDCGDAYKTRNRTCQSTDTSKCVKLTEDVTDKIRECPDDLGFDNWASWSPCTKPCNAGYSHRTRHCNNPIYCFGHRNESKICSTQPCKVHGQFTQWSSWSECSKSCGSGVIERTRSCTNPAPANNGNDCNGTRKENVACNTFHCSGLYLSSLNKQCNQTCFDMGLSCWPHIDTKNTTAIYRNILSKTNGQPDQITCSGISSNAKWTHKHDPSYNRYTKECMGYKAVPHKMFCNDSQLLPVNVSRLCNCQNISDIGYGEWSPWGECSAPCGLGSRTRFRTCAGGCSGTDVDRGSCKIKNCPVNGGFTEFTVWSPCSKTCGGGKTYRYRYCTNPEPRDGGLDCDGNRKEEDECNMRICPVHGIWSGWGEWSLCSKPCNNGTEKRTRFCDNPAPRHGGRDCIGSGTLKRICNPRPCKPVSIGITARFYEEIFHPDLENRSTPVFKALEAKIEHNVRGIYKFQSHVVGVGVSFFLNGSVISNFTVNYTEVTSLELITLLTSLQERKMLNVMPLSSYSLKTAEIPAPPSSLNCTALSSSAIHVKWDSFKASITNFAITGYYVMYKRVRDASAASWQSFVVSNSSTHAHLTRLEAFTTYTIRVTAVTIDASGIPSDYEDVVTLQGRPAKPPNNVSCAVTSSMTIYCQWAMVPTIDQNGNINQYIIKYQKYNDPSNMITKKEWKYLYLKSTQLHHTITGLVPYTRYEVQIHAATIAGEGPGHWLTLKTDEDVPSAAPPNLRTESRKSNVYLDFFWDKIPANSWNGKPTGLKLSYSITRKGSTNIIGGPITTVELAADLTRHRIVGLEANWEVTLYIQGMTAAGAGAQSPSVVAETCLCNEKLYCAWYKKNPYTFKENNVMKGIFPDFFESMMTTICGTCGAFNKTTVYFDRTKNGRSAYRASESDLKAKVSNEVHFNAPISGKKHIEIFEGVYQYVNMIDGTASVFITVDNAKVSKTAAITASILQCWPIFVVALLMTILAGILIWMADQFTNPDEMPTGRFFLGAIQGFWWAFVSMTTVGYGDISPRGCVARSIAIVWTAVGLVVNGILVSSLSTALTVVTVTTQTKIYGANVSAVYNSPEYYLGIRRNGNMNSTGGNFNTSKQALDALIRRKVQGTLLELNEAANLQDVINANGLKIAKKIASTSGMGFVLSGEMASFHTQIRSYVSNSFDVIQALVKNYTKAVVVPVVKKNSGSVTGLFDKNSPIFTELLKNILIVLAVFIILGLIWNYVIRIYLRRRNRVHVAKTDEELIMDHYDQWSGELMGIVDDFMERIKVIEQLSDKQGFDRFRLLLKHFETLPFGLPMWLRYRTTDDRYILAKLKIEEAFLENLNKKKMAPRKKRPSLHLVDLFDKELKVEDEE